MLFLFYIFGIQDIIGEGLLSNRDEGLNLRHFNK